MACQNALNPIFRFASLFNFVFVNSRKPANFGKYIGLNYIIPLADCLSFSYKFKTLRSGNWYASLAQSKMSAHEEEATREVETGTIEGNGETRIKFSSDLVHERIKASLEPLHAQISAHSEMMDRLIRSNSAKETNTASSRGTRHQYESPYSEVLESSRFPTVAPLTTTG